MGEKIQTQLAISHIPSHTLMVFNEHVPSLLLGKPKAFPTMLEMADDIFQRWLQECLPLHVFSYNMTLPPFHQEARLTPLPSILRRPVTCLCQQNVRKERCATSEVKFKRRGGIVLAFWGTRRSMSLRVRSLHAGRKSKPVERPHDDLPVDCPS